MGILALAGPSWKKQPSLVYSSQAGLVVALDLSLSMTSQDLSPTRLQRAKFKITDILKQSNDRNIALIAYAGDAHIASPLTRDIKTIQNMLPALDPYIMPSPGNNLVRLAEQAVALFEQGKSKPRQLLLVTDGVEPQDIQPVSQLLKKAKIQLSILAVGTKDGAPIVKPDGRFFKDTKGQVIMPGLEWVNLQSLANESGARIRKLSNSDSDIEYLLKNNSLEQGFEQQEQSIEFDQWLDSGYWLLIPMLLLSLMAFRKGIILTAALAILHIPEQSWADNSMPNVLLNNNQIAHKQFKQDPKAAAAIFEDQKWKASSLYKAGEYQAALDIWQQYSDAESLYNSGNALAQLQQFDDAIQSYEEALKLNPDLKDAKENRNLTEKIKKQKKQKKQQQDKKGQQGDEKQSSQNDDKQKSDDQSSKQDSQQGDNKNQHPSQQEQQDASKQDNKESQGSEATSDKEGEESQNPLAKDQSEKEKEKQKEEEAKAQRLQNEKKEEQQSGEEQSSAMAQIKSTEQLEQDQAMQQWMERIPDDPGGLLRNKFIYQYKNRNRDNRNGDRKPW